MVGHNSERMVQHAAWGLEIEAFQGVEYQARTVLGDAQIATPFYVAVAIRGCKGRTFDTLIVGSAAVVEVVSGGQNCRKRWFGTQTEEDSERAGAMAEFRKDGEVISYNELNRGSGGRATSAEVLQVHAQLEDWATNRHNATPEQVRKLKGCLEEEFLLRLVEPASNHYWPPHPQGGRIGVICSEDNASEYLVCATGFLRATPTVCRNR